MVRKLALVSEGYIRQPALFRLLKFFLAELMREVSTVAGSSGLLGCFHQLGCILVNPLAVPQWEWLELQQKKGKGRWCLGSKIVSLTLKVREVGKVLGEPKPRFYSLQWMRLLSSDLNLRYITVRKMGTRPRKLSWDFLLEWVWMLQAEESTVFLGAFELQIQRGPGNKLKP